MRELLVAGGFLNRRQTLSRPTNHYGRIWKAKAVNKNERINDCSLHYSSSSLSSRANPRCLNLLNQFLHDVLLLLVSVLNSGARCSGSILTRDPELSFLIKRNVERAWDSLSVCLSSNIIRRAAETADSDKALLGFGSVWDSATAILPGKFRSTSH